MPTTTAQNNHRDSHLVIAGGQMVPTTVINREQWLTILAERIAAEILKPAGYKVPSYRVSCSWPTGRGTATKNRCIGQCIIDGNDTGVREIFVSPVLESPVEVAETLIHEMGHAALPKGVGHKRPFARFCVAVGLEGKPTATNASEPLVAKLTKITDSIGEYPHDGITNMGHKKQPTRLLKVWCPLCKYVIRVTSKWIDEAGCPICPTCHVDMIEPTGDEGVDPLTIAESHTEYAVRGTDQFTVRLSKRGRNAKWVVIDYGNALLGLPQTRITPCESRQDCLDLIEAIREGLLTYGDLDEQVDDIDVDDINGYEPLTDEEIAADAEEFEFLADDEDEDEDFDSFIDLRGNRIDVSIEAYEAETEKREAAGERKSIQIGSMIEKALD